MSPADIKTLRTARGWSTSDLAARLGVSARTVEGYEHGRALPDVQAMILADLGRWPAYDPARPDSYTVVPAA